jgi:hypothetical protein
MPSTCLRKLTPLISALIWMFCSGSLGAQELGRHFQKIRDGIYVYASTTSPAETPARIAGLSSLKRAWC